jgi:hypothetical protein
VRAAWIFALSAVGCGSNDGVPQYATDTIWIEPVETGVHGFQSWTLFASGWEKRFAEKYHVCSIVLELDGTAIPTAGCDTCAAAWATTLVSVDSDCAEGTASDARWTGLNALALGEVPADLVAADPFPGASSGAFARYGTDEWLTYGWAFPADDPSPASRTVWDGTLPFDLVPSSYWKLADTADASE